MNDVSRGRQRPADMGVDMFQMSVDPSSQPPRALTHDGVCRWRPRSTMNNAEAGGAGQMITRIHPHHALTIRETLFLLLLLTSFIFSPPSSPHHLGNRLNRRSVQPPRPLLICRSTPKRSSFPRPAKTFSCSTSPSTTLWTTRWSSTW